MRKTKSKYRVLELLSPILGVLASVVVLLLIAMAIGEMPAKTLNGIYKFTLANSSRLSTIFSMAIRLEPLTRIQSPSCSQASKMEMASE